MHSRTLLIGLGLSAALSGCAGTAASTASAPIVAPNAAVPGPEASAALAQQSASEAAALVPLSQAPSTEPAAKPATAPFVPGYASERDGRLLLDRLLPQGIPDRKGWTNSVMTAFGALKLPYSPQNLCAVLAVAEQESSYDPDPVTPNLSKIVWGEIEKRRKKYLVPSLVVDAALLKSSPNGQSYKARIDGLRTKKQMNALYEDMVRELPFGQTIFEHKNPIRDGGPMQVSVAFAETHVRVWPYPYSYKNLRDEVFSLRGSVYFGSAILLQYPVRYSDMVYRFADYNAGRYSSRNAAFQAALARLTRRKLALDGDLMLYQNKMERIPSGQPSTSQSALFSIAGRLGMSESDILRDLKQEKLYGFVDTPLYRRVFELADKAAGRTMPREMIPQIVLISPKITHHLTTQWFAEKVNGRYHACLARGGV